MKTFVDTTGIEHTVAITIGLARRLKSRSVSPVDLFDPEQLAKVIDDMYLRFDLLWAASEASARGMTVDQFDIALASEPVFVAANDALMAELRDFFQRLGRSDLAQVVARVVDASQRIQKIATERIASRTQEILDEAIARAPDAIDQALAQAT